MHLKCLVLKACGSGEQLHDSGVAGVVRLAIEALMLRFFYHRTDGSPHHIEFCIVWGFFCKTTPEVYMQLYFWFARVANVGVEGADCV